MLVRIAVLLAALIQVDSFLSASKCNASPLPIIQPTEQDGPRARSMTKLFQQANKGRGDGKPGYPGLDKKNLPFVALSIVPVFWGTYGSVIRKLYTLESAPPELAFNCLVAGASSAALYTVPNLLSYFIKANSSTLVDTSSTSTPSSSSSAIRFAGLELGGYLFFAGTLQIFASRLTAVGRVAFITQLTTVFAPLLQAIKTRTAPSAASFASCVMAFVGVILLTSTNDAPASQAGMMVTLFFLFVM
jgi:drug/metabolite transporter (DMT)-like permease